MILLSADGRLYFYGGLYRDVNILAVDDSHFDLDYFGGTGLMVTPEIAGEDAKAEVQVFLTNAKEDQEATVHL